VVLIGRVINCFVFDQEYDPKEVKNPDLFASTIFSGIGKAISKAAGEDFKKELKQLATDNADFEEGKGNLFLGKCL